MTEPSSTLRLRMGALLGLSEESRPAVYHQMLDHAEGASFNYALAILVAAGIATLGLVLDSPAVVIGAMLISPLMGPILAAGLALASADLYLGIKALLSILFGAAVAIASSSLLVWLLPFQTTTHEIMARTNPNLLDLAVALLSGFAGSLAVIRGGGGAVTALPGVAIAVALMPPLCTVGFGIGSGYARSIMQGAGLLFLTNLAAIVTSAFIVFTLVRMDSPDIRDAIDETIQRRAGGDWFFHLLKRTRLARSFGHIGSLRWRIVMLAAVLAALFVPLRQALLQMRDESRARAAIGEALRTLGAAGTIVAQQVDAKALPMKVSLIVAGDLAEDKIHAAERAIRLRSGRDVSFSIRHVAGEEDLLRLQESFRGQSAPPPPAELEAIRGELLGRLSAPLKSAWPGDVGSLEEWELGFTDDQVRVRIRYQAVKPFDEAFRKTLENVLKSALRVQNLTLILDHHLPPRSARKGV